MGDGEEEESMWGMGPKRTEKDLQYFKRMAEERPGDFAPYLDTAMTLADLGRHEEALDHYAAAARLKPDMYATYYYMAHSLHELKRNEEALQAFETAIGVDPDMAGAHNDKGIVLHEMKRYKAALKAYKRAAELDPGDGDICDNVGSVLADMGHHKRAVKWYNRAIRLDPDASYYYYHKAESLCRLGRLEKAAACYHKMMRLDREGDKEGGGPDAGAGPGSGAEEKPGTGPEEKPGREAPSDEIKAAKKAVRADPSSEEKRERLCKLYIEAGMYSEGLESSMELLRLNPDSAAGHRCSIECLRSVGVADVLGLTDEDIGNTDAIKKKVGDALRKAGMLDDEEEEGMKHLGKGSSPYRGSHARGGLEEPK